MKNSDIVFRAMQKLKLTGVLDYKITDEFVLLLTPNFKWRKIGMGKLKLEDNKK